MMRSKPQIVEIVGPAGAGKTTLLQVLSQRNKQIDAIFGLLRARYILFFVANALLLLPTIWRVWAHQKRISWQVIRMMVHLTALHYILEADERRCRKVIVLDQGPVYMLTRLHEYGLDGITDLKLEKWWHRMLNYWAAALNLIVRLDAPNDILMQRIRTRAKWHSIKMSSKTQTHKFLTDFRARYDQIIVQLTIDKGPSVICFDTDREPLNQIVERVLQETDVYLAGGEV